MFPLAPQPTISSKDTSSAGFAGLSRSTAAPGGARARYRTLFLEALHKTRRARAEEKRYEELIVRERHRLQELRGSYYPAFAAELALPPLRLPMPSHSEHPSPFRIPALADINDTWF